MIKKKCVANARYGAFVSLVPLLSTLSWEAIVSICLGLWAAVGSRLWGAITELGGREASRNMVLFPLASSL